MPRAAAGTGYPPLRQSHCESGGACGVEALSRGSNALISLSVYPRRIEYWAKTFSRLGSASRADWLAVSGARARGGAYTFPLWNVDEHRKVLDRTQQLSDAVGPDWEHGRREERRSTGKMDNLVVPAPVELCNDEREAVRAAGHPSAHVEVQVVHAPKLRVGGLKMRVENRAVRVQFRQVVPQVLCPWTPCVPLPRRLDREHHVRQVLEIMNSERLVQQSLVPRPL